VIWPPRASPKLVGTGAVFVAEQGVSVALSGNGNTAIVGGFDDDNGVGAAWMYTRSGGVWSQQGPKLLGTSAKGPYGAQQGYSVSLSGDGNTAIVGGWTDNDFAGAAWVYTRSAGVWSQQAKLVGTGAVGPLGAQQGYSVSLSRDGNTAILGGPLDNTNAGAAWVFTRSGGVWSQQGAKLVGTGAIGPYGNGAEQGWSVSLSGDGNTAIVGGLIDNNFAGAAWAFTRSGGVWSQQAKLVGTGAVGATAQGSSVSLSGDGNTAIVGGYLDGAGPGAAWVYTRLNGMWGQEAKLVGTGTASPYTSYGQGFLFRYPATAMPPSWAGKATMAPPAPRGSTPTQAACGASKVRNWSGPVPSAAHTKVRPSRFRPMGLPR
jgi:hypothetical protein